MDFVAYIRPDLLILIPILVFIGQSIKKVAPQHKLFIPVVLIVISIIFAGLRLMVFYSQHNTAWYYMLFESAIQGILCAATAVCSFEVFKNGSRYFDK